MTQQSRFGSRTQPIEVRGLVIAITGGARGIGLATATMLHGLGAKVAIGDIDEAVLKESATRLGLTTYGPLDVTDTESFTGFLDLVESELGPIDVLINNAGIMPTGLLAQEPDHVTKRILDINILGVIIGSKLAVQRMVPRRHGHVINIASLAGETYSPGLATYCASKYAVVGFTDAARVEHAAAGVHFSVVMPPFVNTDLTSGTHGLKLFKNVEPEAIADAITALIRKPRPRVRVSLLGAATSMQKFLPRRAAEALSRTLGGDTVMLDVDADARRAYDERVRGSG